MDALRYPCAQLTWTVSNCVRGQADIGWPATAISPCLERSFTDARQFGGLPLVQQALRTNARISIRRQPLRRCRVIVAHVSHPTGAVAAQMPAAEGADI